jgi:DNA repair protein RadD
MEEEGAGQVAPEVDPLWDHQGRGIIRAANAIQGGLQAICIQSPTGSGKTRVASEIAARAAAKQRKVLILTHRRILLDQTRKALLARGVKHGVIAANYDAAHLEDVQLGSFPTLGSRAIRRKTIELPDAELVIPDEAHSNTTGDAREILLEYKRRGAKIVGLDATPVGLQEIYDGIVSLATNSELADKGILVNGTIFAPSEPDMAGVKIVKGEFVQGQMAKRVTDCIVFGDVFKHYLKLNPCQKPTVMFAPGVKESRGFVLQFAERGIPAAHIDGSTSQAERDDIFAAMRAGDIKVVSSYGVLREGWDFPEVEHGILCQPCNALSTYLQIVGRLKRSAAGKKGYILQDHAGAWWRHGSPDEDRIWKLADTDASIAKAKKKAREAGEEKQQIRCPECGGIRLAGPECPWCGHKHVKSVRLVRMVDGTLEKMYGDAVKLKRKRQEATNEKTWRGCLYKAARLPSGGTFKQAKLFFYKIRKYWPPDGLKDMPGYGSIDWDRKIIDVPGGKKYGPRDTSTP